MVDKLKLAPGLFERAAQLFVAGILFGGCMGYVFASQFGSFLGTQNAVLVGIITGASTGLLFALGLGIFLVILKIGKNDLFKQYKLETGEELLSEIPANNTQNGTASGGLLLLTTIGVRFIPHLINFSTKELFLPYGKIVQVFQSGRDFSRLYAGGMVPRLVIETKEEKYFFVVSNKKKIIEYLNKKISSSFTAC